MPISVYQMAAMRFKDALHGVIVVSLKHGETEKMEALYTSDGGRTWTSELILVKPGPPYLSRDARWLTVISGANMLTLLHFVP